MRLSSQGRGATLGVQGWRLSLVLGGVAVRNEDRKMLEGHSRLD